MTPVTALAVLAAWHAAFQLTVTLVVYPALAATPVDAFAPVHAAHSRRVLLLVVPTYAALVGVGGWVLLAGPRSLPTVLAVAAQVLVLLVTALAAAPAHGALDRRGPRPELLGRLRAVDAVRAVLVLLGLLAALAAAPGTP